MRKRFLAILALAALITAPAIAADLRRPVPVYQPPPPPVLIPIPIWTWTGCYVGGHVGGLWAGKEIVDVTPVGAVFGSSDHNVNGWLAGVQAGCDYQFAGGWVTGIQADYAWTSAEASHVSQLDPSLTIQTQIESVASATARLGYAWGRFLGYVKGGAAWERDNFNVFNNVTLATLAVSGDRRRSGWTVGVGGEYAFADYLSGFVEFNYYDFGSRDITFSNGVILDVNETKSVLKAGLNFRFGGWGKTPVAARY
jgi:outer membrane immunogenic protein